jgi:hypothetical protein
MSAEPKRRWRDYRTVAGRRPVKEFVDGLSDVGAAAVVAAMRNVRDRGLAAARHLRGDIYEVRADGDHQTYRILFDRDGVRRAAVSPKVRVLSGIRRKRGQTVRQTALLTAKPGPFVRYACRDVFESTIYNPGYVHFNC